MGQSTVQNERKQQQQQQGNQGGNKANGGPQTASYNGKSGASRSLNSATPGSVGVPQLSGTPGPTANAFLGTAAMMNINPYMNMNSMAAARLQANSVAAAAACMPYMSLARYPQGALAAAAAAGYPGMSAGQPHHQNHQHVGGYSVSPFLLLLSTFAFSVLFCCCQFSQKATHRHHRLVSLWSD